MTSCNSEMEKLDRPIARVLPFFTKLSIAFQVGIKLPSSPVGSVSSTLVEHCRGSLPLVGTGHIIFDLPHCFAILEEVCSQSTAGFLVSGSISCPFSSEEVPGPAFAFCSAALETGLVAYGQ